MFAGFFFATWMVIGSSPAFLRTPKLQKICHEYSSLSTANRSHCTNLAMAEMWRKVNFIFWISIIASIIIDRLRKQYNIPEAIRFFTCFTWGLLSGFMVSLIVPVLNDQRKEDASVLVIRFLYMPTIMLVVDLSMRVFARTFLGINF